MNDQGATFGPSPKTMRPIVIPILSTFRINALDVIVIFYIENYNEPHELHRYAGCSQAPCFLSQVIIFPFPFGLTSPMPSPAQPSLAFCFCLIMPCLLFLLIMPRPRFRHCALPGTRSATSMACRAHRQPSTSCLPTNAV